MILLLSLCAINITLVYLICKFPDQFIDTMDWIDEKARIIVERILR